jgi:hypothetical protein
MSWLDCCPYHVLDKLWKSFGPILGQIKSVHRLCETQVGVDAGNDNAASTVKVRSRY